MSGEYKGHCGILVLLPEVRLELCICAQIPKLGNSPEGSGKASFGLTLCTVEHFEEISYKEAVAVSFTHFSVFKLILCMTQSGASSIHRTWPWKWSVSSFI